MESDNQHEHDQPERWSAGGIGPCGRKGRGGRLERGRKEPPRTRVGGDLGSPVVQRKGGPQLWSRLPRSGTRQPRRLKDAVPVISTQTQGSSPRGLESWRALALEGSSHRGLEL